MRDWIAELSSKTMIGISLVLGLAFTVTQGVGVSGWLYTWTRGFHIIWLGVVFNLIRNTLLAGLVVFGLLILTRRWLSR